MVDRREMTEVDKFREKEISDAPANRATRQRIWLLVPFNLAIAMGTIKYCRNISRINRYFWPHRQKVSIGNLAIVSTAQAILFFTGYTTCTLLILGINPRKEWKQH